MDKAEKLSLYLGISLLGIFIVLILYASAAQGVEVPTCITDVEPFAEGQLIQTGDHEYELQVVARMWMFQPGRVEIPAGSELNIYLTSTDVIHGFHIEEKNVNLMAVPGTVNNIRVKFEEPGTYKVLCHEYCGVAHHSMAGEIVVK